MIICEKSTHLYLIISLGSILICKLLSQIIGNFKDLSLNCHYTLETVPISIVRLPKSLSYIFIHMAGSISISNIFTVWISFPSKKYLLIFMFIDRFEVLCPMVFYVHSRYFFTWYFIVFQCDIWNNLLLSSL